MTTKTVLFSFSFLLFVTLLTSTPSSAQENNYSSNPAVNLDDIRWKSESQVRALLGDPQSIRGPIGTHASYQLWEYQGFSVAFSNNRAFHLFDEGSLRKLVLEENR